MVGTTVNAEVAIIFDTQNRVAINDSQGPRNMGVGYEETVGQHHKAFWDQGVAVDVIDMDSDLSKYKVVVAPMLYMVRKGVAERIERFVQNGGTFVATYWSGIVDETDLVYQGGFPGPLRKTLGIWSEEIDALHDGQTNSIKMAENNKLGFSGKYEAYELCDIVHLEGAEALAYYQEDFYAENPALTVNKFGKGQAYYIASRNVDEFHTDFYRQIVDRKSTRLNSSHVAISYAVFCLKKKSLNSSTSTRAVSSNPNSVTRQNIEIIFG